MQKYRTPSNASTKTPAPQPEASPPHSIQPDNQAPPGAHPAIPARQAKAVRPRTADSRPNHQRHAIEQHSEQIEQNDHATEQARQAAEATALFRQHIVTAGDGFRNAIEARERPNGPDATDGSAPLRIEVELDFVVDAGQRRGVVFGAQPVVPVAVVDGPELGFAVVGVGVEALQSGERTDLRADGQPCFLQQ